MRINIYKFLGALIIIGFIGIGCKNPVKELENFSLNLDGGVAPINVRIAFNTNDSVLGSIPKNLEVRIVGPDADKLFDRNGLKEFKPSADGSLELMYSPIAKPTPTKPLQFTIEAYADGCLPLKQEAFLFDKTNVSDFKLTLISITKPAEGEKIITQSLNFLGKKATDSVSISGTDLSNQVEFTYRFPKEGVRFIKANTVRLENSGKTHSWVWRNKTYEYTVYEYRTTFDTLTAADVDAIVRVYKYGSTFMVSSFYDDNGTLQYLPHVFNGQIGTSVYFKEKNSNRYLSIYYLPGHSYTTEYKVDKNANYKCYINGYVFDKSAGNYLKVNNIIDANDFNVKVENDKQIITLDQELFQGEAFLFQTVIPGCGFLKYNVNTQLNAAAGFYGYSSVGLFKTGSATPEIRYGVYWYANGGQSYLPAFPGFKYEFNHSISHYERQAENAYEPLYEENIVEENVCDKLTSGITHNVNFNYNYPDQVWLAVDATIKCKNGGSVKPYLPIYYRRVGAKYPSFYGGMYLHNGKLENMYLRKDQTYYIYTYNNFGQEVGTEIFFDTSKPQVEILDDPDPEKSYFKGLLKYNQSENKFTLDLEFDNAKLRMKFAGCS